MLGMDLYSLERRTLDRHREMASEAEARTRVRGWATQARLAELVARRLRLLADRLDEPEPVERRPKFNVVSGSR
jgi:hypothetical protein